MKKYESPEVKFEELKLSESIANQCWSEATPGGDGDVYYNYGGEYGQVRLVLKSAGNCGQSTIDYIEANGQQYNDDGIEGNGDIFEVVHKAFTNANGANTKAAGFSDNGSH